MRLIWRAIGLAATVLAASSAVAQSAAAPPEVEDAIVVTGRSEPPPRREVFDQALEVSRVDRGRIYEETLARLTAPLCADVVGLDEGPAGEMTARIRANAERLGLRLAPARCTPNLLVAFAEDGGELLGALARRYPRAFGLVAEDERGELLADDAPVRVWNVVETKWAAGDALPRRRGRQETPSVRGRLNQMFVPTRKDIEFALVVYDREAVLGMTVVQLADYATMRGLSHTRPASGDQSMATILALFEESRIAGPANRGPDELTSFDLGYLRSVYFSRPEKSVPAAGRLLGVRRRASAAAAEE